MSLHLSGIGSTATPFRQGKILVVPSGSHLPELCVKCGAPASGKPLTKTFSWHSAGYYFLIFIGLIVYVIVALVVQKKGKRQRKYPIDKRLSCELRDSRLSDECEWLR